MPFNKDFGPLNLAMVHRFCRELAKLLNSSQFQSGAKIYHYTSSKDTRKMTNAAFLMGAFMIMILKQDTYASYMRFRDYHSYFKAFRDASKGDCYYECTILHCLEGLQFALNQNWYNFKKFSVREYEHYEKVENGDLNWIIPGKFIAFMGPVDQQKGEHRSYGHNASSYVAIFKHLNVTKVIRLNESKYDKKAFTDKGIEHEDLVFTDGSTPPQHIVDKFLLSCENHFAKPNAGAIAVHCKAGLGRTGTLIGIYAMKHY